MKLYVYCLAEGIDELPPSVLGIGGAAVRLVKWEKLSLLVTDYPGDAVPVTRENALAHAAVVQSVLESTTPLPFRFGALVTEEQLHSYMRTKQELLLAKLEEVRGCVEMSVKIIWDSDRTDEAAINIGDEKPGTAFLAQKRREILGGEARAQEAKRIAEWLGGQMREVSREMNFKTDAGAKLSLNPNTKLILTSGYLVERDRLESFRTKVAEARQQRPELHFLVSGPWAPYSFANIDLEFETQFGVS
jgi:gas vesicle protein GvpL/GvpF